MIKNFIKNNRSGFTLIESIIYLSLLVIVVGGGVVAAYQVIQGTEATYNHVILQEEANFLFGKIKATFLIACISALRISGCFKLNRIP